MRVQEVRTTAVSDRRARVALSTWVVLTLVAGAAIAACGTTQLAPEERRQRRRQPARSAGDEAAPATEGQRVFRFETFGNEPPWTDTLRLHGVVEGWTRRPR
jgi:hypothetical protein